MSSHAFCVILFRQQRSTMIKFLLIVNKQGHPRILKYFDSLPNGRSETVRCQEAEITKTCLTSSDKECSFFDYMTFKIVFRKYGNMCFILAVDDEENELAMLEFIHNIVETFDKYFDKVCELDIMFNLDRVHMILDEMILNGRIVGSSKTRILAPVHLLDQACRR